MHIHEDQQFIEALLQGDHAGISEIYRRFAGEVRRFVLKNSGSEDDARDMMQEALMIITRQAREKALALSCPFGAYLFLVVRGKWLNELRKRKREAVTIVEEDGYTYERQDIAQADNLLLQEEREQLFWEKFKLLGERCQKLLRLSWSGSHNMEQVASLLGVTYGYARKKKTECIDRLMFLIKTSREFALLQSQMKG
jgi:RNA polymerase sigma factor (sigma-70 family)